MTFHRHYNHALGKEYHTKADYLRDVKKAGLEPFKEGSVKPFKPSEYKGVSEEARRMINSVTYDRQGRPNIGDRYIDKLKAMGIKKVPDNLRERRTGGWA